jgi:hypothetical protein
MIQAGQSKEAAMKTIIAASLVFDRAPRRLNATDLRDSLMTCG